MKTLYEFTSHKKEKVKEETVTKDDEGSEIKSTKEVKKNVPYRNLIKIRNLKKKS